MNTNKKRVSISLHPEIMEWAKKRAKRENRTFSNLIETLLNEYRDKTARFARFFAQAEKGK